MEDLSEDTLLGGRVKILQPVKGYRVSSDAVLLAALAPQAKRVLDLGTGYGQVALCLSARLPETEITGVELLPEVADIARRNVVLNEKKIEIVTADVRDVNLGKKFDLILVNPPYRQTQTHTLSPNAAQNYANYEMDGVGLRDWVRAAARHLAPEGAALFIYDAARRGDLRRALEEEGLRRYKLLPIAPREGEKPLRFAVWAQSSPYPEESVLTPLFLHDAKGSWLPPVEGALRDAARLPAF